MNIVGQSSDYADFLKKTLPENCEEIMSSLYDNNLAVLAPNSYRVKPTTLP